MDSRKVLTNKLSILNKELIILENSFSVLKCLKNKRLWQYKDFFTTINDALNIHVLLILCNITTDKKDLNLFNLIRFIESNLKIIFNDQDIQNRVKIKNKTFLKELGRYRKTILALEKFRDKGLSHIDKGLSSKGKIMKILLNLKEIDELIRLISDIFEFYWSEIGNQYLVLGKNNALNQAEDVIKKLS